mgnify:CR=1 FL=1
MKVLIPILSPKDHSPAFVERAVDGKSVVYLLLILDPKSIGSHFGFKASDIMKGRKVMDAMKDHVKGQRKLCHDIMEWGPTLEKIAQIAEMKQVGEIVLLNSENNPHFDHFVKAISQSTLIPVRVVSGNAV